MYYIRRKKDSELIAVVSELHYVFSLMVDLPLVEYTVKSDKCDKVVGCIIPLDRDPGCSTYMIWLDAFDPESAFIRESNQLPE